jgi:SNF2 family DNA or RNA helicase
MAIEESVIKLLGNKNADTASALAKNGKALVNKVYSFWKSDISVSGDVYENDRLYTCGLTISNDDIASFSCTCDEFLNRHRFCVHAGALAYAYQKRGETSEQVIYTSTQTRKTVNAYLNRSIEKYTENAIYDVELFYEAKKVKNILEVSFFIGKDDKRFKLKNLFEFFKLFEEKGYFEYGRKFGVYHSKDAFHPNSYSLLDFLINNIRMEKMICTVNGMNESMIRDKSRLILVGENLDKFIDILIDKSGSIICDKKEYKLEYSNPLVELSMKEVGNSGYRLECNNIIDFIDGNEALYLFTNKKLHRLDIDMSKKLSVFFYNILEENTRNLSINQKDMPSFCNAVIPPLLEYSSIDMPDNLLEKYKPWELKCDFYLREANDDIYLKIKATYNDEFFDLYKGVCRNHDVCRDYNLEYSIKNALSRFNFETIINGELKTGGYKNIYELLSVGIKELSNYGNIYVSDELKTLKLVDSMKIGARVVVNDHWLNLKIDAGDYKRSELELLISSYREKKKYVKLNDKTIVKLDDNGLELLAGMAYDLDFTAEELINDKIFIPKYRALYIDSRLSGNVSEYRKDDEFKTLVRTIKQVEDSEIPVPDLFTDVLRDYQKLGYRWLKTLDMCGFGGILADDMGLGKTIQILALLTDEYLIKNTKKKSVVIAPTSLIYNWENEIIRFVPNLKAVAVVGAKSERINILKNSDADVFITSYELLKRDIPEYQEIDFRFEILDEAQNIKNFSTISAKAVKKLKAETRFALTGTPIENRLSELWSIFDYVMPGFLYTNRKFREKFEVPIVKLNQVEALKGIQRMIAPFILRRDKKQVLKELPDKLEYNLFAKMDGEQHKLYTANVVKLREEIAAKTENDFASNKIRFLAQLTKLRQICCDPSLCYDNYEDESSKLELCVDLVKNSIEGGHKILLFSQFTSMLDIISKRLTSEGISFYIMTGSTYKEDRMNLVSKFNKDDTSVFLISLKAGGTGLNLTGADIVIHYDPWWNVAVENQATDRAHRIGQEKVVSVFKLITKDSVEENIVTLQKSKQKLSSDIITGENISISNLSKDELLSILNG